jgi:hypothetical protein
MLNAKIILAFSISLVPKVRYFRTCFQVSRIRYASSNRIRHASSIAYAMPLVPHTPYASGAAYAMPLVPHTPCLWPQALALSFMPPALLMY